MQSQAVRRLGFTLIEVMITVAVIAILAAIAYPAYQDQIRKSRRSAAQSTLMEVANKELQLFLDRRSYQAAATAALAGAPLRVAVPPTVSASYSVSVTTGVAADGSPTFLATARSIGRPDATMNSFTPDPGVEDGRASAADERRTDSYRN